MRKLRKSILIGLVTFGSVSVALAETVKVSVNGMVCSFCANGLNKKFSSVQGVEKVNVDLDAKLITLQLKKDAQISNDEIAKLVKEAGYSVPENGISRSAN